MGILRLELTPFDRRADMVCHWEDSDVVAQEVFSNVRSRYRDRPL